MLWANLDPMPGMMSHPFPGIQMSKINTHQLLFPGKKYRAVSKWGSMNVCKVFTVMDIE